MCGGMCETRPLLHSNETPQTLEKWNDVVLSCGVAVWRSGRASSMWETEPREDAGREETTRLTSCDSSRVY